MNQANGPIHLPLDGAEHQPPRRSTSTIPPCVPLPQDASSSGTPPRRRRRCGGDGARAITRIPSRVKNWIMSEAREAKEAAQEAYQFARSHDWKTTLRIMFQRKYWHWWFLLILVVAASTVLSSYHQKIALAIQPYRRQIRSKGWTWILPTVLLILVSFPPLFGHELIILAVGMIWGLLRGFGIACLGTFLGELATYYAFKYWFRNRAARVEGQNLTYACLARLMRDGGLTMVTLVRFSAVPGHLTTAVQSTIGLSVWIFSAACILSLPKQFALVYLGLLLADYQPAPRADPDPGAPPGSDHSVVDQASSQHRVVSLAVFFVTAFASMVAAYIIWMRMRRIRKVVAAEMMAAKKNACTSSLNTTSMIQVTPMIGHDDGASRAELGYMPTMTSDRRPDLACEDDNKESHGRVELKDTITPTMMNKLVTSTHTFSNQDPVVIDLPTSTPTSATTTTTTRVYNDFGAGQESTTSLPRYSRCPRSRASTLSLSLIDLREHDGMRSNTTLLINGYLNDDTPSSVTIAGRGQGQNSGVGHGVGATLERTQSLPDHCSLYQVIQEDEEKRM